MRYVLIFFIIFIFIACDNEDKYIYKYNGNNPIPVSRVDKKTGQIEIYNNKHLIEYESSFIQKAKEFYKDDKEFHNLNDDEFLKKIQQKFYPDKNIEEIKQKAYEKIKEYKLEEKDFRWIEVNNYNTMIKKSSSQ